MRIIAERTLRQFWVKHPQTRKPLEAWIAQTRKAAWVSTLEVCQTFASAKALNGERVRFEVAGGNYRLIVAFDFERPIAFVKFLGTHTDYDRIDPFPFSQF